VAIINVNLGLPVPWDFFLYLIEPFGDKWHRFFAGQRPLLLCIHSIKALNGTQSRDPNQPLYISFADALPDS